MMYCCGRETVKRVGVKMIFRGRRGIDVPEVEHRNNVKRDGNENARDEGERNMQRIHVRGKDQS